MILFGENKYIHGLNGISLSIVAHSETKENGEDFFSVDVCVDYLVEFGHERDSEFLFFCDSTKTFISKLRDFLNNQATINRYGIKSDLSSKLISYIDLLILLREVTK
ncbi:MAG: hypothetical protein ACRC92_08045 [Peptostreptococcaceae bacterium]